MSAGSARSSMEGKASSGDVPTDLAPATSGRSDEEPAATQRRAASMSHSSGSALPPSHTRNGSVPSLSPVHSPHLSPERAEGSSSSINSRAAPPTHPHRAASVPHPDAPQSTRPRAHHRAPSNIPTSHAAAWGAAAAASSVAAPSSASALHHAQSVRVAVPLHNPAAIAGAGLSIGGSNPAVPGQKKSIPPPPPRPHALPHSLPRHAHSARRNDADPAAVLAQLQMSNSTDSSADLSQQVLQMNRIGSAASTAGANGAVVSAVDADGDMDADDDSDGDSDASSLDDDVQLSFQQPAVRAVMHSIYGAPGEATVTAAAMARPLSHVTTAAAGSGASAAPAHAATPAPAPAPVAAATVSSAATETFLTGVDDVSTADAPSSSSPSALDTAAQGIAAASSHESPRVTQAHGSYFGKVESLISATIRRDSLQKQSAETSSSTITTAAESDSEEMANRALSLAQEEAAATATAAAAAAAAVAAVTAAAPVFSAPATKTMRRVPSKPEVGTAASRRRSERRGTTEAAAAPTAAASAAAATAAAVAASSTSAEASRASPTATIPARWFELTSFGAGYVSGARLQRQVSVLHERQDAFAKELLAEEGPILASSDILAHPWFFTPRHHPPPVAESTSPSNGAPTQGGGGGGGASSSSSAPGGSSPLASETRRLALEMQQARELKVADAASGFVPKPNDDLRTQAIKRAAHLDLMAVVHDMESKRAALRDLDRSGRVKFLIDAPPDPPQGFGAHAAAPGNHASGKRKKGAPVLELTAAEHTASRQKLAASASAAAAAAHHLHSVPLQEQGDLNMYTLHHLLDRETLKFDSDILLVVREWWHTAEKVPVPTVGAITEAQRALHVPKQEYMRVMRLLYYVLVDCDVIEWSANTAASGASGSDGTDAASGDKGGDASSKRAKEDEDRAASLALKRAEFDAIFEADWTVDSEGAGSDGTLSFAQWHRALFQLADHWTPTLQARDYSCFLRTLLNLLTEAEEDEHGTIHRRWKTAPFSFDLGPALGMYQRKCHVAEEEDPDWLRDLTDWPSDDEEELAKLLAPEVEQIEQVLAEEARAFPALDAVQRSLKQAGIDLTGARSWSSAKITPSQAEASGIGSLSSDGLVRDVSGQVIGRQSTRNAHHILDVDDDTLVIGTVAIDKADIERELARAAQANREAAEIAPKDAAEAMATAGSESAAGGTLGPDGLPRLAASDSTSSLSMAARAQKLIFANTLSAAEAARASMAASIRRKLPRGILGAMREAGMIGQQQGGAPSNDMSVALAHTALLASAASKAQAADVLAGRTKVVRTANGQMILIKLESSPLANSLLNLKTKASAAVALRKRLAAPLPAERAPELMKQNGTFKKCMEDLLTSTAGLSQTNTDVNAPVLLRDEDERGDASSDDADAEQDSDSDGGGRRGSRRLRRKSTKSSSSKHHSGFNSPAGVASPFLASRKALQAKQEAAEAALQDQANARVAAEQEGIRQREAALTQKAEIERAKQERLDEIIRKLTASVRNLDSESDKEAAAAAARAKERRATQERIDAIQAKQDAAAERRRSNRRSATSPKSGSPSPRGRRGDSSDEEDGRPRAPSAPGSAKRKSGSKTAAAAAAARRSATPPAAAVAAPTSSRSPAPRTPPTRARNLAPQLSLVQEATDDLEGFMRRSSTLSSRRRSSQGTIIESLSPMRPGGASADPSPSSGDAVKRRSKRLSQPVLLAPGETQTITDPDSGVVLIRRRKLRPPAAKSKQAVSDQTGGTADDSSEVPAATGAADRRPARPARQSLPSSLVGDKDKDKSSGADANESDDESEYEYADETGRFGSGKGGAASAFKSLSRRLGLDLNPQVFAAAAGVAGSTGTRRRAADFQYTPIQQQGHWTRGGDRFRDMYRLIYDDAGAAGGAPNPRSSYSTSRPGSSHRARGGWGDDSLPASADAASAASAAPLLTQEAYETEVEKLTRIRRERAALALARREREEAWQRKLALIRKRKLAHERGEVFVPTLEEKEIDKTFVSKKKRRSIKHANASATTSPNRTAPTNATGTSEAAGDASDVAQETASVVAAAATLVEPAEDEMEEDETASEEAALAETEAERLLRLEEEAVKELLLSHIQREEAREQMLAQKEEEERAQQDKAEAVATRNQTNRVDGADGAAPGDAPANPDLAVDVAAALQSPATDELRDPAAAESESADPERTSALVRAATCSPRASSVSPSEAQEQEGGEREGSRTADLSATDQEHSAQSPLARPQTGESQQQARPGTGTGTGTGTDGVNPSALAIDADEHEEATDEQGRQSVPVTPSPRAARDNKVRVSVGEDNDGDTLKLADGGTEGSLLSLPSSPMNAPDSAATTPRARESRNVAFSGVGNDKSPLGGSGTRLRMKQTPLYVPRQKQSFRTVSRRETHIIHNRYDEAEEERRRDEARKLAQLKLLKQTAAGAAVIKTKVGGVINSSATIPLTAAGALTLVGAADAHNLLLPSHKLTLDSTGLLGAAEAKPHKSIFGNRAVVGHVAALQAAAQAAERAEQEERRLAAMAPQPTAEGGDASATSTEASTAPSAVVSPTIGNISARGSLTTLPLFANGTWALDVLSPTGAAATKLSAPPTPSAAAAAMGAGSMRRSSSSGALTLRKSSSAEDLVFASGGGGGLHAGVGGAVALRGAKRKFVPRGSVFAPPKEMPKVHIPGKKAAAAALDAAAAAAALAAAERASAADRAEGVEDDADADASFESNPPADGPDSPAGASSFSISLSPVLQAAGTSAHVPLPGHQRSRSTIVASSSMRGSIDVRNAAALRAQQAALALSEGAAAAADAPSSHSASRRGSFVAEAPGLEVRKLGARVAGQDDRPPSRRRSTPKRDSAGGADSPLSAPLHGAQPARHEDGGSSPTGDLSGLGALLAQAAQQSGSSTRSSSDASHTIQGLTIKLDLAPSPEEISRAREEEQRAQQQRQHEEAARAQAEAEAALPAQATVPLASSPVDSDSSGDSDSSSEDEATVRGGTPSIALSGESSADVSPWRTSAASSSPPGARDLPSAGTSAPGSTATAAAAVAASVLPPKRPRVPVVSKAGGGGVVVSTFPPRAHGATAVPFVPRQSFMAQPPPPLAKLKGKRQSSSSAAAAAAVAAALAAGRRRSHEAGRVSSRRASGEGSISRRGSGDGSAKIALSPHLNPTPSVSPVLRYITPTVHAFHNLNIVISAPEDDPSSSSSSSPDAATPIPPDQFVHGRTVCEPEQSPLQPPAQELPPSLTPDEVQNGKPVEPVPFFIVPTVFKKQDSPVINAQVAHASAASENVAAATTDLPAASLQSASSHAPAGAPTAADWLRGFMADHPAEHAIFAGKIDTEAANKKATAPAAAAAASSGTPTEGTPSASPASPAPRAVPRPQGSFGLAGANRSTSNKNALAAGADALHVHVTEHTGSKTASEADDVTDLNRMANALLAGQRASIDSSRQAAASKLLTKDIQKVLHHLSLSDGGGAGHHAASTGTLRVAKGMPMSKRASSTSTNPALPAHFQAGTSSISIGGTLAGLNLAGTAALELPNTGADAGGNHARMASSASDASSSGGGDMTPADLIRRAINNAANGEIDGEAEDEPTAHDGDADAQGGPTGAGEAASLADPDGLASFPPAHSRRRSSLSNMGGQNPPGNVGGANAAGAVADPSLAASKAEPAAAPLRPGPGLPWPAMRERIMRLRGPLKELGREVRTTALVEHAAKGMDEARLGALLSKVVTSVAIAVPPALVRPGSILPAAAEADLSHREVTVQVDEAYTARALVAGGPHISRGALRPARVLTSFRPHAPHEHKEKEEGASPPAMAATADEGVHPPLPLPSLSHAAPRAAATGALSALHIGADPLLADKKAAPSSSSSKGAHHKPPPRVLNKNSSRVRKQAVQAQAQAEAQAQAQAQAHEQTLAPEEKHDGPIYFLRRRAPAPTPPLLSPSAPSSPMAVHSAPTTDAQHANAHPDGAESAPAHPAPAPSRRRSRRTTAEGGGGTDGPTSASESDNEAATATASTTTTSVLETKSPLSRVRMIQHDFSPVAEEGVRSPLGPASRSRHASLSPPARPRRGPSQPRSKRVPFADLRLQLASGEIVVNEQPAPSTLNNERKKRADHARRRAKEKQAAEAEESKAQEHVDSVIPWSQQPPQQQFQKPRTPASAPVGISEDHAFSSGSGDEAAAPSSSAAAFASASGIIPPSARVPRSRRREYSIHSRVQVSLAGSLVDSRAADLARLTAQKSWVDATQHHTEELAALSQHAKPPHLAPGTSASAGASAYSSPSLQQRELNHSAYAPAQSLGIAGSGAYLASAASAAAVAASKATPVAVTAAAEEAVAQAVEEIPQIVRATRSAGAVTVTAAAAAGDKLPRVSSLRPDASVGLFSVDSSRLGSADTPLARLISQGEITRASSITSQQQQPHGPHSAAHGQAQTARSHPKRSAQPPLPLSARAPHPHHVYAQPSPPPLRPIAAFGATATTAAVPAGSAPLLPSPPATPAGGVLSFAQQAAALLGGGAHSSSTTALFGGGTGASSASVYVRPPAPLRQPPPSTLTGGTAPPPLPAAQSARPLVDKHGRPVSPVQITPRYTFNLPRKAPPIQ